MATENQGPTVNPEQNLPHLSEIGQNLWNHLLTALRVSSDAPDIQHLTVENNPLWGSDVSDHSATLFVVRIRANDFQAAYTELINTFSFHRKPFEIDSILCSPVVYRLIPQFEKPLPIVHRFLEDEESSAPLLPPNLSRMYESLRASADSLLEKVNRKKSDKQPNRTAERNANDLLACHSMLSFFQSLSEFNGYPVSATLQRQLQSLAEVLSTISLPTEHTNEW